MNVYSAEDPRLFVYSFPRRHRSKDVADRSDNYRKVHAKGSLFERLFQRLKIKVVKIL